MRGSWCLFQTNKNKRKSQQNNNQSMKVISVLLLVISLTFCFAQINIQNNVNAPDLPNFGGNPRLIAAGSLIIPMDGLQVTVPSTGKPSVLPYGLLIRSLYDNVTASWAIKTGKQLADVDFTANTGRSNWAALAAAGESASDTNWGGWGSRGITSYAGGPFIIPAQYARKALRQWAAWRANPSAYLKTVDGNVYNGVQIHVLLEATTIDIRHSLFTRPFVGVSNLAGNAPTQTAMMGCVYKGNTRQCPQTGGYGAGAIFNGGGPGCKAFEPQDHAGLDWGVHYDTYDCPEQVARLTSESCLSTFSEPHWQWDSTSGPSYISAVKQFVTSGANFFAQCASVGSYESFASGGTDGTFMSNYGQLGLKVDNGINNNDATSQNTVTNYADLPVNQYMGRMSSNMWGTIPDFYNKFSNNDQSPAGFVGTNGYPSEGAYNDFKTNAFPLVTNIYNSQGDGASKGRNVYVASGAKYNPNLQLGSNVWYLGGHQWVNLATPGAENNRRFFFNAILVPASRPASCGFSFCEPGTSCDPRNRCETCVCDPSGTNFRYTPIAGCCLNNGGCTADCTVCNSNTHSCELSPGCCSTNVNCTGDCQSCQNQNSNGVGTCSGTPGCCTTDNQCTTTSKCVHCVSQACIRTPAPDCCDAASDCTGQCMTCNSSNVCGRQQPLSSCCLTKSDCGTDACMQCNTNTNQCYKIPGCCNVKDDCGPGACVQCNSSSHTCYNKDGCCTTDGQCGACQECSNTTNSCVASSDANCCTTNDDCGVCRRCVVGVGGAKTCLNIPDCCVNSGDCTSCQYCSNSTCAAVESCCAYDSDCKGCDVCKNFTCVANNDLSCCFSNDDCEIARQIMMSNPNATDIPECDLVCYKDFSTRAANGTGVCQSVCSSPRNWTGLIVGLAAGVPLGLLCLAAIAGGLVGFLLWKKDALTGALLNKGADPGMNANTNPAFDNPVTVGTSGL
eukprot:TRINITY_DN1592_c0_g1_i1.p1 TRINITY_DN1592_c0_g1~~TRINITY_DN1592_c0_g1_i1.p1  ORF type:complete len:955 (+),score=154.98 TRINITY_DN1592_c0_g1_i1:363-3227(+)